MKKNILKVGLSLLVMSVLFMTSCSKDKEQPSMPPITIGYEVPNAFATVKTDIKTGIDVEGSVTTDTLYLMNTNKYSIDVSAYALAGISPASTLRRTLETRTDTASVSDFTLTRWNTSNGFYLYHDGYTSIGYAISDSLRYQGTVYPSATYICKIIDYSTPQLTQYRKLLIKRIQ